MIPKVMSWKKDRVAELTEILQQDGVIGIVDTTGVPATAMLGMRAELRSMMSLTMAKKTLFRLAWKNAGLDEQALETLMENAEQPVIVHSSNLSASQLFIELEKTRTGRSAKEGDVAPQDIVVEAGETDFAPGPIVGELSAVGIPAKIDKGKVMIQKTVTVVNQGDEIPGDLGLMLDKLGVKPIEIGIILCGAVEDGVLMPPDVLAIDTMALVAQAAANAISLAVNAGITNSGTIPLFIAQANARALALAGQLDSSALDEELSSMLGAATTVAAAAPAEAAPEEAAAEEEPEEEEEDAFDGLGDLFG
uniref:Ribosomal protein L10 (RP-L10, rplJ) n=2 Tax=environmental samples TaxID=68359 RepID=A0A075HL14_9EURY|nr:ribosomal protein L10 (RP-L10, rplJ) [uncultured marine group II/III euryarchaeote KM3_67_F03]AIF14770.1 ribosomal protein L10 (RP-L10, rplJ) [uncultured marine group II/III euryarchaeote KM3_67_H09]